MVSRAETRIPANQTPDFLSSLSFSPSKTSLVYTAEASRNTDDDPYNKFRYTPHFGEPSRTKKRPTIFLFRLTRSPTFTRATKQDLSLFALSLAQPTQTPVLFTQATFAMEDIIFASGHERTKDGRLLGAKGCFKRPMGIWQLTLPTLEGSLGSKLHAPRQGSLPKSILLFPSCLMRRQSHSHQILLVLKPHGRRTRILRLSRIPQSSYRH
ncbi:hypothetical protein EDB19DRAFT_1192506 [Suillus lakei]|nr:hypothetical protein EDB19DRAFT_1192506 [Suillus lakei]